MKLHDENVLVVVPLVVYLCTPLQ